MYDVTFEDGCGKSRVEIMNMGNLTKALDRLSNLDKFHSWIEYDLSGENKKLKSRIEGLEERLQEQVDSNYAETEALNKEISELQEQIKELKKLKRSVRKTKK
jgi:hypothetical protein